MRVDQITNTEICNVGGATVIHWSRLSEEETIRRMFGAAVTAILGTLVRRRRRHTV